MKKILLILFLIPLFALCQIQELKPTNRKEIGKIGAMGVYKFKLTESEGVYTLTYLNSKYKRIRSYGRFSFDKNNNELYTYLMLMLKNKVKDKTVKINNNVIRITYREMLGSPYLQIYHSRNGVVKSLHPINKRQLNKLFGFKRNKVILN